MDKLVEREDAPQPTPLVAAPALAVQFFLIPLAVVGVIVCVYAGFRMLLADPRTPQEYLSDVQYGGRERRWPAAYELSRQLADPNVQAANPGIGPALVTAFRSTLSPGAPGQSDPRLRRYLALAIGRLRPAPRDAAAALSEALNDPDTETRITVIWALGSLGDPSVAPQLAQAYASDDPGVRKVAVYALGAVPGDAPLHTLRTALQDPVPDVQWNAAAALARHGTPGGNDAVPVLRRMLDRGYVERTVTRTTGPRGDDPVAEVMINGLRAAAALKADTLREPVAALSRDDRSLRVRQAAREALHQMGI